jgi:hypothetical protein
VLPEEAVGGLIGRLIFVNAKDRRHVMAWPDASKENIKLRKSLLADLFKIASMEGTFTKTPDAKELYKLWYEKQANIHLDDPRLDAFHERCHDTALKIAMLMCVAQSEKLEITKDHMAGGIAFIEKQMPEFGRVINWASATAYSQNRAKLIDTLRRSGGISSRRMLMKALSIPHDEFGVLIESLTQEETIKVRMIDKEPIYELAAEERGGPTTRPLPQGQ